ncbi:hypothetical protein ACH5RR_004473 [Cinchona calisaya]|uniref:Glutaredoxin domain-containing protein n=1 Tax=Cinchona calisaya TaxID=153742 RepID=A0ABD3AXP7_9GENT
MLLSNQWKSNTSKKSTIKDKQYFHYSFSTLSEYFNRVPANVETRDKEKPQEGMKTMKGRIIKKLKSISTITSLKQGLVFRTTSLANHYNLQTSSPPKECEKETIQSEPLAGRRITLSEIIKDGGEVKDFPGKCDHEKTEDFRPPLKSEESLINKKCEIDSESGGSALGQLNSKNDHEGLSDSTKLAGFKLTDNDRESKKNDSNDQPEEVISSLQEFEERCPPGGKESVILYTTSMRGIRKTFEDCTAIRFLLESFRVRYYERDVSMHLEYREELWSIMGCKVVPPRLFIRGRYIGGADEVVGLHERGLLRKLMKGIPLATNNCACNGCAGVGFVLCFKCNGSRKIINQESPSGDDHDDDEQAIRCSECNENGLVKCPICSLNK